MKTLLTTLMLLIGLAASAQEDSTSVDVVWIAWFPGDSIVRADHRTVFYVNDSVSYQQIQEQTYQLKGLNSDSCNVVLQALPDKFRICICED